MEGAAHVMDDVPSLVTLALVDVAGKPIED